MDKEKKSSFREDLKRDFDSDVSPENPVNVKAVEQRGLMYNPRRGYYVDEDGCPVRDEFGQSL